jgi:RecA-family ATPase
MDYRNNQSAPIAPAWAVDVPDKPLEWFYPNVFVRGELNGVQGIPGDGKTWLMCELAAQTSVGGLVQGTLDENDIAELPQGKALYLSGDDAPERLKERLASRGADLAKIAFAPEGSLPQIGSPEMAALFEQICPTLCIMDTLQHFIGGASCNDMGAITVALQPLQLLARRYNTAAVVVMHISKFAAQGNGGDSTSFSIGSYAIAGIFRTLWTLGRLKGENGKPAATRALCVSKNNYAEFDPPALLFELRDGFRWSGVDFNLIAEDLYNKKKNKGRPAEKRDSVKSEIERLLCNGESMLSAELEQKVIAATGCHAQTVKAAKKDLGVNSFQSGGKWHSQIPGQSTQIHQSTINSESAGTL